MKQSNINSNPNDVRKVEDIIIVLKNLIVSRKDVSPHIWVSALWGMLLICYRASSLDYNSFIRDWEDARDHYKKNFEDKK